MGSRPSTSNPGLGNNESQIVEGNMNMVNLLFSDYNPLNKHIDRIIEGVWGKFVPPNRCAHEANNRGDAPFCMQKGAQQDYWPHVHASVNPHVTSHFACKMGCHMWICMQVPEPTPQGTRSGTS